MRMISRFFLVCIAVCIAQYASAQCTDIMTSDSLCAGELVAFTASGCGGGNGNLDWTDNNAGSEMNTGTYEITLPASGTIEITVTDDTGPYTETFTINSSVSIGTQPTASTSVCQNGAIALTATASGGSGTLDYQWQESSTSGGSFTDIPGATSLTYIPVTSTVGTQYYQLIVSDAVNGCTEAISTEAEVVVIEAPSFSQQPASSTTTCENTTITLSVMVSGGSPSYQYQWQESTTSGGSFTNVSGATNNTFDPPTTATGTVYYQVVVSDATSGCPDITSAEAEVEVVSGPSFSSQPDPLTSVCEDGSVTLSVSVMDSPVPMYQWQSSTMSGSGFANITGAILSTYSPNTSSVATMYYRVILSDVTAGCDPITSDEAQVVVVSDPEITANPTPLTTVCQGANITLVGAGTGGFSLDYQWRESNTSSGGYNNISGATNVTYNPPTSSIGNKFYRLRVSDNGVGCDNATSSPAEVIVNADLVIDTEPVSMAMVCEGGSLILTVVANGGSNLMYQWQSSSSSGSGFTDIGGANASGYNVPTGSSGTTYYRVVVSDSGDGCDPVTSMESEVVVTPNITITSQPQSANVCQGATVVLTVATTSAPGLTYQWESSAMMASGYSPIGGATMDTYNVPTGSSSNQYYRVIITNPGNGCNNVMSMPAFIEINDDPSITSQPTSTTSVCANEAVVLTVSADGGTNLEYQWEVSANSGGPFSNVPSNGTMDTYVVPTASSGTNYYRVQVTDDGDGCGNIISTTSEVIVNEMPTASAGNYTPVCSNSPEIQLNGIVSGSVSTGTWSGGNGSFNPNATTLNAVYTPNATEISAGSVTLTLTSDDPDGIGGCDADTDMTTISINNGVEAVTISNSQTVICIDTETMPLGGLVTLTNGPPGEGIWDDGGIGGSFSGGVMNENANYSPPSGFVGDVTLTLTANDPDGSGAGNPCPGGQTSSITISVADNPDLAISGSANFCTGSSSIITAVETGTTNTPADWMIIWSNGSTNESITLNAEIEYSVTVTDMNGCSSSASITGVQDDNLDITISFQEGSEFLCGDETATICADGGDYSYEWGGGMMTQCLTDVGDGTYEVTVTDNISGCTGTDEIVIEQNDRPTAVLSAPDQDYCMGTTPPDITITLEGQSPFDFTYTDGTTPITINGHASTIFVIIGASEGNYTVTTLNDANCPSISNPVSNEIVIEELDLPPVSINPETPSFCPGSSVNVMVNEAYGDGNYEWRKDNNPIPSEDDQSIEINVIGNYSVIVTDANDCMNSLDFVVTEEAEVSVSISGETDFCLNGSTTLTIPGTVPAQWTSIMWSDGTMNDNTITVTDEDTYSVTVENAQGCMGSASVTTNFLPLPSANPILPIVTSYCADEDGTTISFQLIGVGPFDITYSVDGDEFTETGINTNELVITNAQEGVYTIISVTDSRCSTDPGYESASITVTEDELPDFSVVSTQGNPICEGSPTTLSADISNGNPNDFNYTWGDNSNSQTIMVSTSGIYTLLLEDKVSGCTSMQEIDLLVFTVAPTVMTNPIESIICENESILLSVSGAATIIWDDPVPSALKEELNITVSPLVTTTFTGTITTNDGCTAEISQEVVVKPLPVVDLGVNPDLAFYCEGSPITMTTQSGYDAYLWSNGTEDINQIVVNANPSTTEYFVTATEDGCDNMDMVSIVVREKPTAEQDFETLSPQAGTSFNISVVNETTDDDCTGIDQYVWSFTNNAGASVFDTITEVPNLDKTFSIEDTVITNVSFYVIDACGCSSDVAETVFEVRENGSCGSELTFPDSYCIGNETVFLAEAVRPIASGSVDVEGYWIIDGIAILPSLEGMSDIQGINGTFDIPSNGVEDIDIAGFNERITVIFNDPVDYELQYYVNFEVCERTSPPIAKDITATQRPELVDIIIDTVICDGEEISIEFDLGNNNDVDWTISYEVDGSGEEKALGGGAQNTIVLSDVDDNADIRFTSLFDNDTGCENKDLGEFNVTLDLLDPLDINVIDSCNLGLDSVFYTINVTGGSGDYSIDNTIAVDDTTFMTDGPLKSGDTYSFFVQDDGCTTMPIIVIQEKTDCITCFNLVDTLAKYGVAVNFENDICDNTQSTLSFDGPIDEVLDLLSDRNQQLVYVIQETGSSQYSEMDVIDKLIASGGESSYTISFDMMLNGDSEVDAFQVGNLYYAALYVVPKTFEFKEPEIGCPTIAAIAFEFYQSPIADIELLEDTIVCENEIDYQISSVNSAQTTRWSADDGVDVEVNYLEGESRVLLDFGNVGVESFNLYLAQENLYNIAGGQISCVDTAVQVVTPSGLTAPIKDSIISFPGGLFTYTDSDPNLCYQWGIDDTTIDGETTRFLILGEALGDRLLWIDAVDCSDTEAVCVTRIYYNALIPPALSYSPKEDIDITLYPNPTDGTFTVKLVSESGGKFEYSIFDSRGQTIKNDEFVKETVYHFENIDISSLASGLYFVRLHDEGGERYLLKVVKN